MLGVVMSAACFAVAVAKPSDDWQHATNPRSGAVALVLTDSTGSSTAARLLWSRESVALEKDRWLMRALPQAGEGKVAMLDRRLFGLEFWENQAELFKAMAKLDWDLRKPRRLRLAELPANLREALANRLDAYPLKGTAQSSDFEFSVNLRFEYSLQGPNTSESTVFHPFGFDSPKPAAEGVVPSQPSRAATFRTAGLGGFTGSFQTLWSYEFGSSSRAPAALAECIESAMQLQKDLKDKARKEVQDLFQSIAKNRLTPMESFRDQRSIASKDMAESDRNLLDLAILSTWNPEKRDAMRQILDQGGLVSRRAVFTLVFAIPGPDGKTSEAGLVLDLP